MKCKCYESSSCWMQKAKSNTERFENILFWRKWKQHGIMCEIENTISRKDNAEKEMWLKLFRFQKTNGFHCYGFLFRSLLSWFIAHRLLSCIETNAINENEFECHGRREKDVIEISVGFILHLHSWNAKIQSRCKHMKTKYENVCFTRLIFFKEPKIRST